MTKIIRYILIVIFNTIFSYDSCASFPIMFLPVDSITRFDLHRCETLVFLQGDSVLVSEGYFMDVSLGNDLPSHRYMFIDLPMRDTEYKIMLDAEGYNTRTFNYKVDKSAQENRVSDIGEIGVLRLPKQLNEVTVEATKIRLYYKGDTLIYNADAFMLPDGSMLDDLIRKLDGVRIDEHGQIFCNGRKVKSLQLQGRQLFDGNPKTLLENLGAYTVSKIKVYDYVSEREQFLGYSSTPKEERELVMDVNLKKEYSIGKWVNIDAGYGSADRYLGRGFMLGFSPTWAFSGYVNANNLGNSDNPQKDSYWGLGNTGNLESSYLNGGVSYQNDWRQGQRTRKIKGTVSVSSDKLTSRSGMERVNYLSTGDTYENSYSCNRFNSFGVKTTHSIDVRASRVMFSVSPLFNYSSHHTDGSSKAITLNEYFGRIAAEDIEAIYSDDSEQLRRHIVNRSIQQTKGNRDELETGLNASTTLRLPDILPGSVKHNLTLNGQGSYSRSSYHGFNISTINYGVDAVPASYFYAYSRRRPRYSYSANASANYAVNIKGITDISLKYEYYHNTDRNTFARYLLNELKDDLQFGQLPADMSVLSMVKDLDNSNRTFSRTNTHNILLNVSTRIGESDFDKGGHGSIFLTFKPSMKIYDRSLNYYSNDYDSVAARATLLPNINATLSLFGEHGEREQSYDLSFGWNSSGNPVSMRQLISVPTTSDPLYITAGNPDLRNSFNHRGSAEFAFRKYGEMNQQHSLKYEYSFTTDAVTTGVNYNQLTGVRISRPYNVDGNRYQRLGYTGNGAILHRKSSFLTFMRYEVGVNATDYRSVDMVSTSAGEPTQSFVYCRGVNPSASITANFSNILRYITISARVDFNRYTGDAAYYTPFTSSNYTLGFDCYFLLRGNVSLSTDFKTYTRNGYTDSNLNTTEYIWNISASWHWKKANITFFADLYDLLRQCKNVRYYADQMGRIESWFNTLPRYAMLRLRYHINLTPQ